METIRDARIIACSRGRLRIGVPALYHSPAIKQRLEAQLGKHGAMIEVYASALTGRLLLRFHPTVAPTELLAQLGIAAVPSAAPAAGAGAPAPPGQAGSMYPCWHAREAAAALAWHASSAERGLSRREAAERLRQGKNLVALPKGRSSLDILLSQFKGAPVLLLGLSAAVSLFAGALAEATAIGAVLALNGAIGFSTERRAEASITSLSELVDDSALVVRDGAVARVDAAELVPGDIVELAPGTRIAADMRLLHAHALKIDESALTGESLPVEKQVAALSAAVPLAERYNMAYRGTAVASGSGRGLVVGTGSHTEAGAVEALTRSAERPLTPIQAQLDQLGKQLVALSAAMCCAVVAVGMLRGHARGALFRSAIALAVAAIPEGLPAVATTSLVRGLLRMRRHGVLIRHLHAVETIGTISTICLDKTGTLTMNRMNAVSVCTARHRVAPEQAGAMAQVAGELERLLQVCVLSSESEANHGPADAPLQSSPTEAALLALAQQGGIEPARLRQRYPLVASELRAEGRHYMRSVHATPQGGQLVAVKGSPAQVLALCSNYLADGQLIACEEAARAQILQQNDEMARQGLRVLGFAYAETAQEGARPARSALTWLGLVGLADPLRPGVALVIERFHRAGIRTTMLTGDQAGTARQIGAALRLNEAGEPHVVNADALAQLPPERWRALAADAHVFSRVTPSDKLRIVQALQASHATVAMTGDGINDSPAMRAADVGIAMGSGTGMALSAADVALQHDRLAALLDAVAQGRSISDNIRKAVHFLVSSNLSEILTVLGAVACGGGSPLNPLQLLWLNLLTDVLPAIALSEEAPESDVMRRPPRDARAPLVGRRDMLRYAREAGFLAAGALGAYGTGVARHGEGARASTIAFDALVLAQLAHAGFCRTERPTDGRSASRRLTAALGVVAGVHGLAHLVPSLRRLLGLRALGPLDMLAVAAGAGLPLLANRMAQARDQSSAATNASAERSTSASTMVPTSLEGAPFKDAPSPATGA